MVSWAQMVKLLVQHGADMDARDADRQTPLFYAALCEHSQVRLLLVPTRYMGSALTRRKVCLTTYHCRSNLQCILCDAVATVSKEIKVYIRLRLS